jgi:hypothetical protein
MPPESPPAGRRLAFEELPARQRKAFYTFAVGRQNTERYLRVFERFHKQRGLARFLGWNWSAFFCTLPWLAYRRMPGLALVYFVLAFVLVPVQIFAFQQSCPGEKGIPYAVLVGWLPFTFLLMPAVSDWLYYRRARRLAVDAYERRARRSEEEPGTSASSATGFAIGGLVVFLFFFAQAGTFHPVTYRPQMSEVVLTASAAKDEVAAFHAMRGRLPRKGEIGPFASTAKVRSVTFGDAGIVTVVASARCLEGQSIRYTPAVADGRISWRCSTPDIDFRFLPEECRQRQ